MIAAGDIHVVDVNDERRRHVLVISSRRFNDGSRRVLVAPEISGDPAEVPFPWRVEVGGAVFAIDFLRSLPIDRLLERTDRASASVMALVKRTLINII